MTTTTDLSNALQSNVDAQTELGSRLDVFENYNISTGIILDFADSAAE